jgi:ABC-2 type transport system ATP-binding protein
MSSHILQEIQATVDRIIIIDEGKIVADGTSDELISGAQGMTQLHLEISNTEENVIQEMKTAIPGVELKNVSKNNDVYNIQIEYPSDTDPRKDIFNYAVENSCVITEMRVTEKNLEDIFRNLTGRVDEGVNGE